MEDITVEQVRSTKKSKLDENPPISNTKLDEFNNLELDKEAMDQKEYQECLEQRFTLENLPDLVLEKTFGFLSFHEMAKARTVCHTFNNVCMRLLNRGFYSAKSYHEECQKKVNEISSKQKCLCACSKSDTRYILYLIDVSFLLLELTYHLCIESNRCCFIPGKVLDEIYHWLFKIDKNYKTIFTIKSKERKILELEYKNNAIKRTSIMAINHFLSEICPAFKDSWTFPNVFTSNIIFLTSIVKESFTCRLTTNSISTMFSFMLLVSTRRRKLIGSIRREFQTARMKDENQPNGLEQGLEPEMIVSEFLSSKEYEDSYFLIKWKDADGAEFIKSDIIREKYPNLIRKHKEETNSYGINGCERIL